MKIGLFFGSFNPIHIGHLILSNHIFEFSDLDQIWFVVSPHNPHKSKHKFLNDYERFHLVKLAIDKYPRFKASNIEFQLQQPSYTIDTLMYLKANYSNQEFIIIIGEDNFLSFKEWKNYQHILANNKLIVYPRITKNFTNNKGKLKGNITKIDAPIIQISSTLIREMIRKEKNTKPLLPQPVFDYIESNRLYKL